jgi:uncharacterized protein DUF6438
MWTMTCRVIASVVTFLIGWTVFAIASPAEQIQQLPERAAPQIFSITLRRQGCSDAERECPVYDATYRSDGTCTYVGYANDEFIGKYEGDYNPQDYTDLVEQINKQGFFELPLVFGTSPATETTSIEIVTSDGTRLVTTYNWASTPSGLRSLQALIEEQAYEANWEKAE